MKTRPHLMQKLNSQLGTNFNWSRLNLLDLSRLVVSINKKFLIDPSIKQMDEDFKEELALEQEQINKEESKELKEEGGYDNETYQESG